MLKEFELPKAYDPKPIEGKWYDFWLKQGYFTPKIDPSKKPFVIIMPPPNVTGELHLGHALTATIEDILIRWHRMKGEPTLWLPGTDHAGIAAQVVVEQHLAKEGLTRHQLGREKFLEKMWEWMRHYRRIINEQHMRLGASCDWTRERFTLDEGPSKAVRTTFVRLFNKGLIYRGERIINWCPRCSTALSDLEVEHKETKGFLYYVKYPLLEGGFIVVATTRPETLLGDTGVAVHPEDKRYKHLIGKIAILPVIGREIPIIADKVVDINFGTGAVKVTPAHDPTDFEIGQRHNLPSVNILNPDGTMNENAGPFNGLDRFVCREKILVYLKERGLLEKIEPYIHFVGTCERCGTVIEPLLSKQWFIKIAPLAKPAIEAVLDGRIKIIPEHFTKVYLNWLENIKDWCISRQLWWGHRIPVWYCKRCDKLTVSIKDPTVCQHCGSEEIYQDPDVLDTWFSSALWPHSTLGWPDDSEDFRYFYPTTVMETGYDILFFWVARMIMMGLENTGNIPFRYVFLHGLIRDEKGEKMSKVKGNVLNPLDLIEKYGTDALRFALTIGTTPGNDLRIGTQKLEAGRNFANKIWNAARYVLNSLSSYSQLPPSPLKIEDRWILSRLNRTVKRVNELLSAFEIGEAEREIYDFFWGEFCDWYIELSKVRFKQGENPLPVLVEVLETCLRLLHPFMPFITEELWHHLKPFMKEPSASIMIAPYPTLKDEAIDPEAEAEMEGVIEIIRSIRHLRTELKVEASRWIEAWIYTEKPSILSGYKGAIEFLARVCPLHILGKEEVKAKGLILVLRDAEVVLSLSVELEREKSRIRKEIEKWQEFAFRLENKLREEAFISRAPSQLVEQTKERLAEAKKRIEDLERELKRLSSL